MSRSNPVMICVDVRREKLEIQVGESRENIVLNQEPRGHIVWKEQFMMGKSYFIAPIQIRILIRDRTVKYIACSKYLWAKCKAATFFFSLFYLFRTRKDRDHNRLHV